MEVVFSSSSPMSWQFCRHIVPAVSVTLTHSALTQPSFTSLPRANQRQEPSHRQHIFALFQISIFRRRGNGSPPRHPSRLPYRTLAEAISMFPNATSMAHTANAEQAFRLFNLPQELQDNIFAFAYPRAPNSRTIFKADWNSFHPRRDLDSDKRAHFPPLKVNEWLISRRFFLPAATTWISAQDLERGALISAHYNSFDSFVSKRIGLWLDNARAATVKVEYARLMSNNLVRAIGARCPKLRELTLGIGQDFFTMVSHKEAHVDRIEETDFAAVFTPLDGRRAPGLFGASKQTLPSESAQPLTLHSGSKVCLVPSTRY